MTPTVKRFKCRIHGNDDPWEERQAEHAEEAAEEFFMDHDDDAWHGDSMDVDVKEVGRGKKIQTIGVEKRTSYSA